MLQYVYFSVPLVTVLKLGLRYVRHTAQTGETGNFGW